MTEAAPADPVAAVVHPDPYPYYARLRKDRPLYRDAALGCWVASSSAVILEALAHASLRVRPPQEPVPRALTGTPVGEVFALLVRMNDGEFHVKHKPEVKASAARHSLEDVARAAAQAALDLATRADANALAGAVPVQAVARLLGVPEKELDSTVQWVVDLVQGIAPGASAHAIERASTAAVRLMAQGESRCLDKVRSANRIALMQQSLDATAGLIGNTSRLLNRWPQLVADHAPREQWRAVVAEMVRWDSPVQNTRRFAASDTLLAGEPIAQGEGVLLVLASGNRDEAFNPDPDNFDPHRTQRRSLSFGSAAHGCPGEAIAIEIAASALKALHDAGHFQRLFARPAGFRPLANARIPVFQT